MHDLFGAASGAARFARTLPARAAGLAFGFAIGLSSAWSAPPAIDLPDGPIATNSAHPNLMLDLSIEFPTAGSTYKRSTYLPSLQYVGYFDPTRCYTYPVASTYKGNKYDDANDDAKYFVAQSATDANHNCSGQFSGNFLNWAASSAIDILRLTMSGGDRVVDLVGKTVLQRANLQDFFYADPTDFPMLTFPGASTVRPRDVTPFTAGTIYVISCRNRVLFSDTLPVTPSGPDANGIDRCDQKRNPDKNLGEYLVRVEVCSDSEGPRRSQLCKQYGSHFKPEGEIQRNADKMHFAVMGYLLDDDEKRYGGVLGAPMKYVGANAYDAQLRKTPNPYPEWNPATGQLWPDPIGNPSSPVRNAADPVASGVINVLNRFGRSGKYKTADPVGELLYEGFRYLQGLQPTPEAISGITPAMRDDHQVVTSWVDPIIQSCQKTSVILIADAYTHSDFYIPGNTKTNFNPYLPVGSGDVFDPTRAVDATSTPPLDIMNWTRRIGILESSGHGIDTTSRPQLAGLENQKTGFWIPVLHSSYYSAALSYWANVSELRRDFKGINAQTYVIDVDELGNGLMGDDNSRKITHPRDSQLYLAAKYGAFTPNTDMTVPHDPFDPYWPPPSAGTPRSVKNCFPYPWDPTGTCDPENYFLATDGRRFEQAVQQIFAQQALLGEAVTAVTTSSSVVTEGTQQYIYQGKFLSGSWAGDLRRYPVNVNATGGLIIGQADDRTPTKILKEPGWPAVAGAPAVPPRRIMTLNAAPNPPTSTVAFEWANLTAGQKGLLNSVDNLGEARLHYLRGSTNDEYGADNAAGHFRARPKTAAGVTNLLGDIIHSSPVFVGAPRSDVQGAGYQAFASARANRAKAVYVGANDGMLHAFSPELDREYFAYVPAMLFSGLSELTRPTYSHRAYVDGAIAVSEARVGANWRTVLAATMGRGTQGVIALDVTDPDNFSATNGALWEFSDADDADMGNSYGAPTIAKILRPGSSAAPVYDYYVVVASGVNNYAADGAVGTAPGGALFLLSLNKGAGVAWQRNVNYFKFPIPDNAINLAAPGGLSAPALVTGSDGAVRFAYAGDLQGNLWRFAFPTTQALSTVQPYKLFSARDAGGAAQSITAAPSVVFSPDGGYVVLFGTGKYMENTDLNTRQRHSFYGIRDTLAANFRVAGRNELTARTLAGAADATQLTLTGGAFAYTESAVSKGWYMDFNNAAATGERSVTAPQLGFGQVFFNTLIPASCPAVSGGRTYAVNSLTGLAGASGGATGTLSTVGILGTPLALATRPSSQAASTPNAVGRKTVRQTYAIASFGSRGAAPAANRQADLSAGRLSWREIFNYKGLQDGN
ncbi:MAG: pilus assembly protein PilY [Herminiimonas sp.]|nr:pilus assembly protein PilY [Herminiimonas sp.]